MGSASFFSPRMPRALLAAVLVAGCSGDLTPPVGIDGDNTVNAIMPVGESGPERAAVGSGSAYPAATTPVTSAGDGYSTAAPDVPVEPGTARRLPMIDSDDALGTGGATQASAAAARCRSRTKA